MIDLSIKEFEGWTPEVELASSSNKNGRVILSATINLDNSSVGYQVLHYVKNKKKTVQFSSLESAINYYNGKL